MGDSTEDHVTTCKEAAGKMALDYALSGGWSRGLETLLIVAADGGGSAAIECGPKRWSTGPASGHLFTTSEPTRPLQQWSTDLLVFEGYHEGNRAATAGQLQPSHRPRDYDLIQTYMMPAV